MQRFLQKQHSTLASVAKGVLDFTRFNKHLLRSKLNCRTRPCSESPKNKQDKALPADSISEVMALFVQNESNKAYLHR